MKDNYKTNAMRILDSANISYEAYSYEGNDGKIDGISVADKVGQPYEKVFKTLVTVAPSKLYYVFVIPVDKELNLKAAAKAVGEKSVEMIKVTDINKVTGYIRGGCSPVGMKKEYKTVIDESVLLQDKFFVSAGRIGFQLEISPSELKKAVNYDIAQITL
ncbi:MAG: Cys-tRNA(Pro) deacylase [Bacillota bacterium]|nr:Cys-tRNA(Pro) deacylase [Bacillota bacterium]